MCDVGSFVHLWIILFVFYIQLKKEIIRIMSVEIVDKWYKGVSFK